MKSLFLLLQIGELFQGRFNWRGAFQLFLFILMGLIIVGFGVFTGSKAFAKPKKKDDIQK